ncbi:MAG: class I SAM-dependent methyltransferase [bacterium]|nr:class I SAM-dependent methyltransferase [bacterium]
MVKLSEVRDWYDDKHKKEGDRAWRSIGAYSVFLDYLNVRPNRSLLDIACGTGYLLKRATDRGLSTFGLDLSEEGVKLARKNSPKSQIVVGRAEKLPFGNEKFDYVTCIGALEHFLDMDAGLQEMLRVGQKTAKYCLVVPNKDFIYWKFKSKKGTEQQDINENLLSLEEWIEIFNKFNFVVRAVYPDKWHADKLKFENASSTIGKLYILVQKLIWNVIPFKYSYQFIFLLSR